MKDPRRLPIWSWLLLLLQLSLVTEARSPQSASSAVELHVSTSALVEPPTKFEPTEAQDVHPTSNLTSTVLLDFSSRSRAGNTSALLQNICSRAISEREAVKQCNVFGYASLANWTELSEGLPCLPHLENIYWQRLAPPLGMKDFLEQTLPATQIHVDIESKLDKYNRTQSVHEKDFAPLAGAANLATLKAHIKYGYEAETDRLAVVHQLFAKSPNLRDLELTFAQGGCVWDSPQPRAFDFQHGPLANATLPSLRNLKLHWYDYDGRPWRGNAGTWMGYQHHPEEMLWPFSRLTQEQVDSLPQPICLLLKDGKEWLYGESAPSWLVRLYESVAGEANLPKAPLCHDDCNMAHNETLNIDLWLERMSFADIESLEVDYLVDTVASRLFPALKSLSSLTIQAADDCSQNALLAYLHRPHRPISALHLPYVSLQNNTLSSLTPALLPSASSLRSLTIPLTITPTVADLDELSSLPNLTALTMHHPRTLPLLSHYSSELPRIVFPSLKSLTLHIPSPGALNSRCQPQRHDFLFNRTTLTSQLQSHLYPNISPNLTRLEILLGEWSRRLENSLIGPPLEVVGRYVCERSTDDPDPSKAGHTGQWQCSGGLRTPTAYGGCDGRCCGCEDCDMRDGCHDDGDQRPFVEGPKGAVVVKGEEEQGTEEDEEGRSVLESGWVVWQGDENEVGGGQLALPGEEMEMGALEYDPYWDY